MSTSAEALTWAWKQSAKPMVKLLLVALAGEATRVQGGPVVAEPGLARLVSLTGMNESTVVRNLRQLVADGLVTRERGAAVDGGRRGRDRFILPVSVLAGVAKHAERLHAERLHAESVFRPKTRTAPSIKTDIPGSPERENLVPKKRSTTEKVPSSTADPGFTKFWGTYPRKQGKAEAFRKYALAIRKGASAEAIQAGVERLAVARAGQDPQFTPMPTTWLHQGRWEDDDIPVPAASAPVASVHSFAERDEAARLAKIQRRNADPWAAGQ